MTIPIGSADMRNGNELEIVSGNPIPGLPVPVSRVGVLTGSGKGFQRPGGTQTHLWVTSLKPTNKPRKRSASVD